MKQIVTITQHADRHRNSTRDFATSWELTVTSGSLLKVLAAAAGKMEVVDLDPGRYTITVSEPFEGDE